MALKEPGFRFLFIVSPCQRQVLVPTPFIQSTFGSEALFYTFNFIMSKITQTECRAQPQTCGIELNFFKILS